MAQFIAPGVYTIERDFSDYVASLASTSVGMVGTAASGPINVPTLCTTPDQFISTFGQPTPNQFGPLAALNYLRRGNQLWYNRVAKQYKVGPTLLSGTAGSKSITISSGTIAVGDYVQISEPGKRTTTNLQVTGVSGSTITFATDGNSLLETYSVAASVGVCPIALYPGDASEAACAAEVVAYGRTGNSGGSTTALNPVVLFQAASPGSWANFGSSQGIEIQITDGGQFSNVNPNTGQTFVNASGTPLKGVLPNAPSVDTIQQLVALSATAPVGQVRGVNSDSSNNGLGTIYQLLSSASAIQSIAFSTPNVTLTLTSVAGFSVGDLVQVSGATATGNNGTFTITGVNTGLNTITYANAAGAAQGGAAGTALDNHWVCIGVLTKRVTVLYKGRQVEVFDNLIGYDPTSPNFWDTVIGTPSAPVSKYITCEYLGYDGNGDATGQQPINTLNSVQYPHNPRLLMGVQETVLVTASSSSAAASFGFAIGYDGSNPNEADYVGVQATTGWTGLQSFLRTEHYDINMLCAPGVTLAAVIQSIIAVCAARNDCLGVIDTPFGLTPQEAVDWHNGTGIYSGDHSAFVGNQAACYYPWVKQLDPYSGTQVWVPPTALIPGVVAYSDSVGETWYAPAGITRGTIPNVLTTAYPIAVGDVEFFYGPGNGNAINPIMTFAKDGIVVYGQRTLQRFPSALDRVNVRRLLFYIEKAIATSTRKLVFEQDDTVLWAQFVSLVTPFLKSLRGNRALQWFQVVCDSTTNTPQMMNNNEVGAKIYLIPTKTAEKIILDFTLLASGTNVSEFIAQDLGLTLQ